MSRETLDGGGVAQAPVPAGAHLDLSRGDDAAEPPASPLPVRRRVQVLRTALAALVVAVLAGTFATVAEQRRAQAGAEGDVRLLGAFVPGGSFVESAAGEDGIARVSGLLSVVNAGADPVEITGATVSDVRTTRMDRPRRVEPGEAVEVHTTVELPCSRPVDDRVLVELRVLADGGSRGRAQREALTELPDASSFPLHEHVLQMCAGNEALAVVTHMQVDPEGTVVVELQSLSQDEVEVRVLLAPRMGALVNGAAVVYVGVPAGGETTLLLSITIEDCERARQSLGVNYDVLTAEAGGGQPGVMGYVDGWQSSVGTAAFGFALARQC